MKTPTKPTPLKKPNDNLPMSKRKKFKVGGEETRPDFKRGKTSGSDRRNGTPGKKKKFDGGFGNKNSVKSNKKQTG